VTRAESYIIPVKEVKKAAVYVSKDDRHLERFKNNWEALTDKK